MKTHSNQQAPSGSEKSAENKQASTETILQAYKMGTVQLQAEEEPVQPKENKTGLPDQLKSGVENISGYSLDDVNVHYNSSKPATLQAHAYAQGTDIHVAPGQEKHLPHEAWHVVQQKQGRVQPTKQLKGATNINDDAGLEKEADVMGAKAMQMKSVQYVDQLMENTIFGSTAQLESALYDNSDGTTTTVNWDTATLGKSTVGKKMVATNLTPESLDQVENLTGTPPEAREQEVLMGHLPTDPNLSSTSKFIRGHLLNHHIGGPGRGFNMYPITASANSAHLKWVERDVKKWIEGGKAIDYSVVVNEKAINLGASGAKAGSVTADFICNAENKSTGKKISETIPSTLGIKSIPPSMKDEDFD